MPLGRHSGPFPEPAITNDGNDERAHQREAAFARQEALQFYRIIALRQALEGAWATGDRMPYLSRLIPSASQPAPPVPAAHIPTTW